MHIRGSQKDVLTYLSLADAYTDKEVGSENLAHRRGVLIQADSETGLVTFTAENRHSAIRFHVEDLEIVEDGQILVKSAELKVALGVMRTDATIDIATKDDQELIHLSGARMDTEFGLFPISSGKITLPSIGEPEEGRPYIQMASEEFISAFRTGSTARDARDTYPIANSVHVGVVGGKARFTSTDGRGILIYKTADIEEIGVAGKTYRGSGLDDDSLFDDLAVLLDVDITYPALDYVRRGKSVRLYIDDENVVHHLYVMGDKGAVLYRIRVVGKNFAASTHPQSKVLSKVVSMVSPDYVLKVDRSEALRVLLGAASMCSLDPTGTGGQNKRIGVEISDEDFGVYLSGQVKFEDWCSINSNTADKTIKFLLSWGLYGRLVESSPNPDVLNLLLVVMANKSGARVPRAIILYSGDGWEPSAEEQTLPSDFLAMFPISEGEFVDS